MTKIFLNGQRVTCTDWSLWIKKDETIMLTVTYPSGKKFSRPYEEWIIEPTIKRKEDLIFNKKKNTCSKIDSAVEVGEKYLLITYPESKKVYVLKCDQIVLEQSAEIERSDAFLYFKNIAQERLNCVQTEKDRIMAQSIVSQFDRIVPCQGTALNAYLSKNLSEVKLQMDLIYSFGINETQYEAVKNAFKSQISIIEGPPGTGKTQTILNIIANVVINKKTCAIVSNNNSAVKNIYEKLAEVGLDLFVAKLGRNDCRKDFLSSTCYKKQEPEDICVDMEGIQQLLEKLEKYLHARNELAYVKGEIQEIEIEKKYLDMWGKEHPELEIHYIKKYNLDYVKTIDLFAYLKYIEDKALTWKDKWNLLYRFKIFRSRFLDNIQDRENFLFSLQMTYYDKLLAKKEEKKKELEKVLEAVNFEGNLERLKDCSMKFLWKFIFEQMPDEEPEFTYENYQKDFANFVRYFPVIGSSTHSLVNSVAPGYLLDYVIIDEASQQDLVPGILCLGCAKNVVIVGDRKQLSHIPAHTDLCAPEADYDCVKYSLLDSVCRIFGDLVPVTLLKEHYRCHPRIIQFCNKQFYDGMLIPMKEDHGELPLSVIFTAAGNHMRNYRNQREIESVMKVNEKIGFLSDDIGFVAPYNNQVELAAEMLPRQIVENTIHKFQGRECKEIIFSTVLDKKLMSKKQLNFVDHPELVNVAVSRAKDKFTLVTGKDVFEKNNKYIAALIRYIEYYEGEDTVTDSPVISAFDLLYSEYDKSLEKLAARLNPKDSRFKSEQIGSTLLREILAEKGFEALEFHKQIYLKQLVTNLDERFSERENQYIKNRASCDFVIYYRIGKRPMAVIEVDGGDHDRPEQKERDSIKNCILEKVNLPLLRLKTTDSDIYKKMRTFIRRSMGVQKE